MTILPLVQNGASLRLYVLLLYCSHWDRLSPPYQSDHFFMLNKHVTEHVLSYRLVTITTTLT